MTDTNCHKENVVTLDKNKRPVVSGKWAFEDSYNLASFDQTEGIWPIDHPLPLPAWSPRQKESVIINKVSYSKQFHIHNK